MEENNCRAYWERRGFKMTNPKPETYEEHKKHCDFCKGIEEWKTNLKQNEELIITGNRNERCGMSTYGMQIGKYISYIKTMDIEKEIKQINFLLTFLALCMIILSYAIIILLNRI